eukprot:363628-Chlamydomonas_euryale.AAC.3
MASTRARLGAGLAQARLKFESSEAEASIQSAVAHPSSRGLEGCHKSYGRGQVIVHSDGATLLSSPRLSQPRVRVLALHSRR